MTAKKGSASGKKSTKTGSGTAPGAGGPRVVGHPSTMFQKGFPQLELRSPLLGAIPAEGEEVLFDLQQIVRGKTTPLSMI